MERAYKCIHNYKLGIEYDGKYWHQENEGMDLRKKNSYFLKILILLELENIL